MSEYVEIEFSKIHDPENPLREQADDESILDLAQSIAEIGLLQPIVVKPDGDKFEVVAGHRRFLALSILKPQKVTCKILGSEYRKHEEAKLTENIARKNLSPLEEAIGIANVMELKNLSPKAIAKQLGRSEAFVRQRLEILDLPEDIQMAIHKDNLPVRSGKLLAKVDDPETRKRWISEAKRTGASARTIGLWVNGYLTAKAVTENTSLDDLDLVPPSQTQEPKGTCFVCKDHFKYPELKSVLLCKNCYITLLKAIMEGEVASREPMAKPSSTDSRDNLH